MYKFFSFVLVKNQTQSKTFISFLEGKGCHSLLLCISSKLVRDQ